MKTLLLLAVLAASVPVHADDPGEYVPRTFGVLNGIPSDESRLDAHASGELSGEDLNIWKVLLSEYGSTEFVIFEDADHPRGTRVEFNVGAQAGCPYGIKDYCDHLGWLVKKKGKWKVAVR